MQAKIPRARRTLIHGSRRYLEVSAVLQLEVGRVYIPSEELDLEPVSSDKRAIPHREQGAQVGAAPEQEGCDTPSGQLHTRVSPIQTQLSRQTTGIETHVPIEERQVRDSLLAPDVRERALVRVL